jgi:hypothetical protein
VTTCFLTHTTIEFSFPPGLPTSLAPVTRYENSLELLANYAFSLLLAWYEYTTVIAAVTDGANVWTPASPTGRWVNGLVR